MVAPHGGGASYLPLRRGRATAYHDPESRRGSQSLLDRPRRSDRKKKSRDRDDGAGPRFARSFEAVPREVTCAFQRRCCSRIPPGAAWILVEFQSRHSTENSSVPFQSSAPNWLSRYYLVKKHGDTFRGEFSIARSGIWESSDRSLSRKRCRRRRSGDIDARRGDIVCCGRVFCTQVSHHRVRNRYIAVMTWD